MQKNAALQWKWRTSCKNAAQILIRTHPCLTDTVISAACSYVGATVGLLLQGQPLTAQLAAPLPHTFVETTSSTGSCYSGPRVPGGEAVSEKDVCTTSKIWSHPYVHVCCVCQSRCCLYLQSIWAQRQPAPYMHTNAGRQYSRATTTAGALSVAACFAASRVLRRQSQSRSLRAAVAYRRRRSHARQVISPWPPAFTAMLTNAQGRFA